jgi:hypothetical protein
VGIGGIPRWQIDDVAVRGITNTPFPGSSPSRRCAAAVRGGAMTPRPVIDRLAP